ncbi:MAG: dicarboxylate/amino acid:cation symporter [Peptoniphilaceae bacterium]|nr:dicarboxylate/amino acid:cation symporter [Peptoniphilaceae bacterium]MDY6019077.1 dicarboxylate/amino acid:cation symporter [Anaerococcus sp.]
MKFKKKLSLTTKIFMALIGGLILGILLHYLMPQGHFRDDILVDGIFYVIGQLFIRAMQMLVVPLVFFSIVDGVRNMGDTKTLGSIGGRILIYYLITTAIAIVIALSIAKIINPGLGMKVENTSTAVDLPKNTKISFTDTILEFIPTNPIQAMSEGNMIQIIVFAVVFGIILSKLQDRVETLGNIVTEMNDFMMEMTKGVMKLAPIGVFFLITRTFTSLGYDAILSMITYMISVFLGLAAQLLLVYMLLLFVFVRINPFAFLKKFLQVMTFGFSTASSSAAVPANIKRLEEIGVDTKISSFTIPLGATINMDGTAIMQGVAVVFIANVYGIKLTPNDYLTVILTATIASIGTAAIPSVGLVTLSMVLTSVGLPVEGIAMIMGIDRILDMSRTAINLTGDAVGTIIVANSLGEFNKEKFKNSSNS